MNDPIVVTRELVKRGWSDIEPKLVTALASGAATAFLVGVAKAYGVNIPESVISAAPLFCALLIGYLTPSVGTTVTKKIAGNGTITEAHSGAVVSTFTAPTKIQVTAPVASVEDQKETAVMPSRADAIVAQLPSATPEPGTTTTGDRPPWMDR